MGDEIKGSELELAKKLLKLDEKLRSILESLNIPKWENSFAWFAYQGHRREGIKGRPDRRFTVLDFLQRCSEFDKAFVLFDAQVREARYAISKIEMVGWAEFWFTLSICRECKGEGGAFIVPDPAPVGRDGEWAKCKRCGGRGLIEILDKTNQVADEVEAYQLKKQTQDSPEWTGATNSMGGGNAGDGIDQDQRSR